MNTKTTKIQEVKEKFESNQQFIQKLGVSDLEYKNLFLEIGCEFLEERYPIHIERYYCWYQEFAFSKSFWQWWKLEWNNWLSSLIKKDSKRLSEAFPRSMRLLKLRLGTNTSFQENYLKINHNGSTKI